MFDLIQHPIRQKVMILATAFLAGFVMDAVAAKAFAQTSTLQERFDTAKFPTTAPLIKAASLSLNQEPQENGVGQNTRGIESMFRPLSEIEMGSGIFPTNLPDDQSNELAESHSIANYPGSFQSRIAVWDAPNIRYQPLYFEDVSHERYGYTGGPLVQPVASAAYFGTSLFMLPINMVRERPGSCTTPLGFCRPGSPAPYTQPRWLIQR